MVMMIMQPDDAHRRSSQRLPVNPRRHKVAPEQRKRVATACNGCNVRRIKCSGETPCRQCASSSRECVYPVAVEKVSVPRADLDDLKRKVEAYERALSDIVPDPARRQEILQQIGAASPASSSAATATTSAASPPPSGSSAAAGAATHAAALAGPSSGPQAYYQPSSASSIKTEPVDEDVLPIQGRRLRDSHGAARFFGETSEASFLDHIKEFMGAAVPPLSSSASSSSSSSLQTRSAARENNGNALLSSVGRYTTSDSQSLHDLDVDPLWLPSSGTLASMLTELRYLIQDGNGEWSSGGIFWWGDLSSLPTRSAPQSRRQSTAANLNADDDEDFDLSPHRHLAFHQAALAVLCQVTTAAPLGSRTVSGGIVSSSDPHPSEASFARASDLLESNPLDVSRCTAADAATLAMLGLYMLETNRRDMAAMYVAAAARVSVMFGIHRGWTAVDERAKRVFWTVYVLDRWVSILLGRLPNISDDSIRLPLPADVPSMPSAAGLAAHVDLARISGHIVGSLCRTYPINNSIHASDRSLYLLEQWVASLPPALQLSAEGVSADPATCLLHMEYDQLILVATRATFFTAIRKLASEHHAAATRGRGHAEAGMMSMEMQAQTHHLIIPVSASQRIIQLVRHVGILDPRRRLLHIALQSLFSAAICLVLSDMVGEQTTPTSTTASSPSGNEDVDYAIQVFDSEAQNGNQYAGDCVEVVRGLVALAARFRAAVASAMAGGSGAGAVVVDPSLGMPMSPMVSGTPSAGGAAGGSSSAVGGAPGQHEGQMYDELMSWMENDWSMFDQGHGGMHE